MQHTIALQNTTEDWNVSSQENTGMLSRHNSDQSVTMNVAAAHSKALVPELKMDMGAPNASYQPNTAGAARIRMRAWDKDDTNGDTLSFSGTFLRLLQLGHVLLAFHVLFVSVSQLGVLRKAGVGEVGQGVIADGRES